jgi:DNA-binding NtrC family response regulator
MGATILVVDDDDDIRHIIAHVLTRAGFDVVSASDPVRTTQLIRTQPLALALFDLRIGNAEHGQALLAALRQDATTVQVPVLFCSDDILLLRSHRDAVRRGQCAILEKPFDSDALLSKVARTTLAA